MTNNKRYLPTLPELGSLRAKILCKLWLADVPVSINNLAMLDEVWRVRSAIWDLISSGWPLEQEQFGIDELYIRLSRPLLTNTQRSILLSWMRGHQVCLGRSYEI